jgi:hypothetical protein
MNFVHTARVALAAVALSGSVMGASVAPSLADQQNMQPTQTLFTSATATQDPAKAFDTPGSPLYFWGIVAPNASGTVVLSDGTNPIGQGQVNDGQFSIPIPAYSQMSLGRGTHYLTVEYQGNDDFAPSTSPVFTEVIQGQHF